MPKLPQALAAAAFSCVLAAGLVVATGATASADRCPSSRSPRINGAKAHWTLACDMGDVKVYGWVDDTSVDGKCAVVRIRPAAGQTREFEACGFGTRETFSVTFDEQNVAEVTLRLR
ncbi:hypothetical protein GCM10010222_81020 [Streptomyces tanashiensis]|uniref:hypothetical protein n=1 Tax=Streptomyces tanashiensis TaxID=67367 RepID=UPI001675CA02|nr:hypothetical protein [Streptomyces tanashiensis]GGT27010.1 hypothetical protein GCM10010222_81020 [Streptomyces tanashiensis]